MFKASNENIEKLVEAISKCSEKDTVLRAHTAFDVFVGFLAWGNKDELAKCFQGFLSKGNFAQDELDWFQGIIDAIHKKEPSWECYLLKTRAALTAVRRRWGRASAISSHVEIVRHPLGDVDTSDLEAVKARNRWALADNAGVLMVCPESDGYVLIVHPLFEKRSGK